MWRRDLGLAAAAALAAYTWTHLVPGSGLAAAQLRGIIVKQRAMQDQLDLIDKDPRGSSPVAPANPDAGRLGRRTPSFAARISSMACCRPVGTACRSAGPIAAQCLSVPLSRFGIGTTS